MSVQPKPIPDHIWQFPARVDVSILDSIVDGDTADLELDRGMHGRRIERFRFASVNAPERKGATLALGNEARQYVREWVALAGPEPWPLYVRTYKSDVFGRYLADIWRRSDGAHLNADLVNSGHAIPFMVIP